MDDRKSEEEKAKRARRRDVKNELDQVVQDFACLAVADQERYEGHPGEAIPQVMGCGEDSSPRNLILALNLTGKNFVANADTIDQSFCLDGSIGTEMSRHFVGMCVDTFSMYHPTSQGVKPEELKPRTREKTMFSQGVTSKLNCTTSTVQGFMERIILPRDLDNESFDTFLRFWFTIIRSPTHVSQDYNCVPFKAALEARQICKHAAYGRGNCLRWGADEAVDAETFLANWSAFHDAPDDEQHVKEADPKTSMGLSHPEVFANPHSKYFSSVKDREDLLCTIPNDEAKPLIVALRQHILRLKNNPQSYLQLDSSLQDVFRPHEMTNFYKLPRDIFVPGDIQLASQKLGSVKTPSGIEKHMPQHVKICDTHLLLHRRAANKKHFQNLRELLPLHSRVVTEGNQKYTELQLQPEFITPEGYWVLCIPSTIRRDLVVKHKQVNISSPQYLFDLINTRMQDRKVTLSRYDTRTPGAISKYSFSDLTNPASAGGPMGGEDDSDAAYESDSMSDSDGLFDDVVIDNEDDIEHRYNEFLLAVDRFIKGRTGKTSDSTHLPVWLWEHDKEGHSTPFNENSAEPYAQGVSLEIPYIPDWVEAHRAASEMPEGTDPQTVDMDSVKSATNAHVTEAIKFLKIILAKSRYHTTPICVTRVAKRHRIDEEGRRMTEPDLDDDGNPIVNDDGTPKTRYVYDHVALRVGVHHIRPMPKNKMYVESMRKITRYCNNTSNPEEKPLPLLYENCPKSRQFEAEWASANFSNKPEASQKAKCWWEQKRHPPKSNPQYVANLKQYIENGVRSDVKGLSTGPDYTRAQFSTTQAYLIENSITFKNGEMGLEYLQGLGLGWVKKVAKSANAEWYIKKAIQPWFDDTYALDEANNWVVKPSVEYPEICRIDPDHAFEDVFEVMLHTIFDHLGSVFNQYKYCHLVYATFGTAFRKPESNELANSSDSTAASLKFVGDTATGKSHKCSHVLCLFKKDRHVLDEQGNSALCGLGVIWDYRECAISFSDETNEDKDQEALRQEKIMQTQGFISRGRSAKKMCPDGIERWVPDYTNNRTNMARVACVNEEAKGGENVKANEDRCLKIYAQESRVAFMKPKNMHGATCRTLKSAIMAQHFQDPRVSEEGKRVLAKMTEHTERLAAVETFITTLPSEARDVDMEVAHIRWRDIAAIMSEKGVVWNDRPRLYTTMLQLSRFKAVEMATLAAFEAQRREDGSKIPFTPENFWEIIPYLYTTERTACKVFHYCATESLGINYNFPIMNSLFEALSRHEHTTSDENGVRTRFMQSNIYDPRKMVFVYKISRKAGRAFYSSASQLPNTLKSRWGKLAQDMYGVNKTKHDFTKDWERLKKSKNSLSDWKIRQQKSGDTIEIANQNSPHTVYHFPTVGSIDRQRLPIIEKIDQTIEPYNDEDFIDAISVEIVKGAAPVNEGDPDYSRDEYAIIQIGVATLRYTIEQRHARTRQADMKDDDIVDVIKEFERVDKNLIKKCFMEVCSYKNNMKDPCQKIINAARKKSGDNGKNHVYTAADKKNPLYYRQRVPGMRYKKAFDNGKKIPKKYRSMTIAEAPTFHGGQVLNATIIDSLVFTENKFRLQEFSVNNEEINTTAAALGEKFYKAKKASKEKKSKSKPLAWNIDIRAHYERFLKIGHETNGLLRGTEWAYKEEWNEKQKRDFFRDIYCKRFPPYSVLVFNFAVSPDAGHTPQNLLAEYIDASRRSKLKRRNSGHSAGQTNPDEDEDSQSFWGDDEDEDEDEDHGFANRQEGGSQDPNNVIAFGDGDGSMPMDLDALGSILSDFDGEEEDEFTIQPQSKKQRREGGASLQEMMDHVGRINDEADASYIPPAVQSGGDGNLAVQEPTYFGDSGLGSNLFVSMEADEN